MAGEELLEVAVVHRGHDEHQLVLGPEAAQQGRDVGVPEPLHDDGALSSASSTAGHQAGDLHDHILNQWFPGGRSLIRNLAIPFLTTLTVNYLLCHY